MTDALDELPIGAGSYSDVERDPEHDDELAQVLELPPATAAAPTAGPLTIEVEWEARRLKRPLQLVVGRTVNWRIRRRLGVDTDAGLMSDEQAINIAEPAAEILNRYEPTRALAARGAELELMIAIYDYVQETSVRAGQAAYRAHEDARRPAPAEAAQAPPHPFPSEPVADGNGYGPLDEGEDQL